MDNGLADTLDELYKPAPGKYGTSAPVVYNDDLASIALLEGLGTLALENGGPAGDGAGESNDDLRKNGAQPDEMEGLNDEWENGKVAL